MQPTLNLTCSSGSQAFPPQHKVVVYGRNSMSTIRAYSMHRCHHMSTSPRCHYMHQPHHHQVPYMLSTSLLNKPSLQIATHTSSNALVLLHLPCTQIPPSHTQTPPPSRMCCNIMACMPHPWHLMAHHHHRKHCTLQMYSHGGVVHPVHDLWMHITSCSNGLG